MIIRNKEDVQTVRWGNGTSHRLLVAADRTGYTMTDTVVWAGTSSRLEYRNHIEACYCISGTGAVVDMLGNKFPIEPGVLYALDEHDAHFLEADEGQDLRLICTFTPALRGDEVHSLDSNMASAY